MEIEQLEQIAAVIVTAGLVAGNFLMFTPWRDGQDPRRQQPQSSIHHHLRTQPNPSIGLKRRGEPAKMGAVSSIENPTIADGVRLATWLQQ